jgi:hypothetical protein
MKSLNEDVFSTLKDAKNIVSVISKIINGENTAKSSNYLGGSISQYSKNLVMTFPVLCDNTLSPDTASMICKANERNVTTMLQLLFGAMNIEANDGMKVISQIHNNISASMDVYQVIDKMNDMSDRAIGYAYETVKGNFGKESEAINEMMHELKYGKDKAFPVSSFSENSLNGYTIQRQYNKLVVKEAMPFGANTKEEETAAKVVYRIRQMYSKSQGSIQNKIDYINSQEFIDDFNKIINSMGMNNISD